MPFGTRVADARAVACTSGRGRQLAAPDQLYRDLGCKTAVGMPFKDIATIDSVLLRRAPDAAKSKERQTLRRLQDAGLGVVVPVDELARNPVPNAVALVPLASLPAPGAPPPAGAIRVAVAVRGDESDADMARLVGNDAVSTSPARACPAARPAPRSRSSALCDTRAGCWPG